MSLIYAIIAVLIVSLASLTGALTLTFKEQKLHSFLMVLVSVAAGTLFGEVFFHLIPEYLAEGNSFSTMTGLIVMLGIIGMLILEKVLHWRHCHHTEHDHHIEPFGINNLVGDALHNFIDGMIIGSAFLVSPQLGIVTSVAVFIHEVPQELADFGVLVHSGMSTKKALLMNLLSGLTSIIGVLVVFSAIASFDALHQAIIPFGIGVFLYVAGSDLIPELHKETALKKSIGQITAFSLGVLIMLGLTYLPHGHDHGDHTEETHEAHLLIHDDHHEEHHHE
jgi:zinc and cadmium transporter